MDEQEVQELIEESVTSEKLSGSVLESLSETSFEAIHGGESIEWEEGRQVTLEQLLSLWMNKPDCFTSLDKTRLSEVVEKHTCLIVTDCESVKEHFDNGHLVATDISRVHAGLWRKFHRHKVHRIVKIRSHTSYKRSLEEGTEAWWTGSNQVDQWAKDAALYGSFTPSQISEWRCDFKQATALLYGTAMTLCSWPGEK